MRALFYLLYHPFAGAYDTVAAVVSLGQWVEWVKAVRPYLRGPRILEIGCGPGHLQVAVGSTALAVFGVDASRQMLRLARRRLISAKEARLNLARARSAQLPYPPSSFNTVVATFPAEFIFEAPTLDEVRRVLAPGGRLVVLPMAWHTGKHILARLMAWLFRLTGETPGSFDVVSQLFAGRLAAAGFSAVQVHRHEAKASTLLVLQAETPA